MKLEEAAFFLDLAVKVQDNVKVFSFFINAFFAGATSIRSDDGVMAYQYRKKKKEFQDWLKAAEKKMNVDFSSHFWVCEMRNGILHRRGTIQPQLHIPVTIGLMLRSNKDGGTDAVRYDPPPENRLCFAKEFDEKEGGKVIVDRCREYLDALTQMVDDCENKLKSP